MPCLQNLANRLAEHKGDQEAVAPGLQKRIGPFGSAVGQDGDRRLPALMATTTVAGTRAAARRRTISMVCLAECRRCSSPLGCGNCPTDSDCRYNPTAPGALRAGLIRRGMPSRICSPNHRGHDATLGGRAGATFQRNCAGSFVSCRAGVHPIAIMTPPSTSASASIATG